MNLVTQKQSKIILAILIGKGEKMKALVLCGGIPQIALIEDLKSRGIYILLADMNPNVVARDYADEFFPVSVLDVDAIRNLAKNEQVDFVITVCADQVLQVVAQVSEELGLPCYIDFDTAKKVSNKELMKKIFHENGIPTSKYVIAKDFDKTLVEGMRYPIIVKPVDSYSSRGVKKVNNIDDLEDAFVNASNISRIKNVIVEEFVEGVEVSVDAYVELGVAKTLCISQLDKIPNNDKFVIHRCSYPALISPEVNLKIELICQKIAEAFNLINTPLLVQLIVSDDEISVLEFCARTGGGDKFRLIKKATGFDVVSAVVDLTLGLVPHVDYEHKATPDKYITDEFLYCREGQLDHFEGFAELKEKGYLSEYFELRRSGDFISNPSCSGDRVAYFTIESKDLADLKAKHKFVNDNIKVIGENGNDLLMHDLIETLNK